MLPRFQKRAALTHPSTLLMMILAKDVSPSWTQLPGPFFGTAVPGP